MKKLTLALTLITGLVTNAVFAQSLDNAKKMFMYERYKTAVNELNGILKATPANGEAYYWAVLSSILDGKKAEAGTLLAAAKSAAGTDPFVIAADATLDLFSGNKDQSKAKFDAALVAGGKKMKSPIVMAIGRAHGNVGKSSADVAYASEKLTELLSKEAKNFEARTLLGDVYRRLTENGASKASVEYLSAIQLNPAYPVPHFRRGQIFQAQDNCGPLSENYKSAVAADPNFMPAYREMFEVYGDNESACFNLNEARNYLDKYIGSSDGGIDADRIKVRFNYFNAEFAKSIAEVDNIMAKYPNNKEFDLYLYKALAYKSLKDSIKSKEAFEQYFAKQDPSKITARNYLRAGEVTATIPGKEAEAIAFLQKSIDLQPEMKTNALAYTKIAEIYDGKLKDYKNAVIWHKLILEKTENVNSGFYVRLGNAQYKTGDYSTAYNTYVKMDSLFPTDFRGAFYAGRSGAIIDSNMTGFAANYFQKFVTATEKDSIKYKATLLEAYNYLSIYHFNKQDKAKSMMFYQKIKWLEPNYSEVPNLERMLGLVKPVAPAQPKPAATGTQTAPKPTGTKPATGTKPGTTPAKPTASAKPVAKPTAKPPVKKA